VVNKHLRPRLGGIVLSRLTREQVQAALGAIGATGVSTSTTAHIFHILRIALNEAVRSDLVRSNVCLRVQAPETHPAVISPWDAAEINTFLDSAAGDRYAPLFTTAIATGLRQGELLGLNWSDVDWATRTPRVERQLLRDGTFGQPKSSAGVRTIGLSDLATYALQAQRNQQVTDRFRAKARSQNPDNLVFTTSLGSRLGIRAVWHAFRDATDGAGVRRIRFHDLRHACAILLLTAGEELEVISKVLGHAGYGTTLKVYAHLDPTRAKAAAGRIDAALGRTLATLAEVAT
jgi:integrase